MDAYQLTNTTRRRCACVCCCLHGTHIAAYKYRHVSRSDILLAEQLYVRCLNHGVGSFNCADESFGLDHTECF
jgi:hypothetical protein